MPKTFLNLPHGLEVLIIKAAVDPEFKALLLARRAEAAGEIGLTLTVVEAAMLAAIPAETLEATIAQTQVLPETRRVFLGKVAAAMLAALGMGTTGCIYNPADEQVTRKLGISPDDPTQALERKFDELTRQMEQSNSGILTELRAINEKQESVMDDLNNAVENLANQMNQQSLELNELQQQIDFFTHSRGIRPGPSPLGIRPDRLHSEAPQDWSNPPNSDVPKPKAAQTATSTTEEMIDLKKLVKFPKPSFGHSASDYRGGGDVLRDGWDVSPDSKRKE